VSASELLVTRPQPQADEWVAALRARGVPALALPLIEIEPDADAAAAAWLALDAQRLVVFVSPNGVQSFFAQRPASGHWPAERWAAATGPGTSRALRAAGVPSEAILEPSHDAVQFDSEALWRRLQPMAWRGQRVLVVRGDGGRDWLAERLREQGAEVAFVQAYRRSAPRLDGALRTRLDALRAAPARHAWLFSSSQAVVHLQQLMPQSDWSAGCALATHPRIADTLREAGFGAVWSVRPTLDAVVSTWERSIQSSSAPDQRP